VSMQQGRNRRLRTICSLVVPGALLLGSAGGCTWDQYHWFTPPPPPPPPVESFTLRGDKLEAETALKEGTPAAELAGAKDLYRQDEYEKAEKVFHKIAENTKNPPPIAEEARYYEAECLRRQSRYPKAADTYNRMLNDFPSGAFREQAVQHMFEIAMYWLEDTRKEMRVADDKDAAKHWVSWPESLDIMHLEKTKPLFDEEGRALEKLEQVRYNDMTGPLADKALFLSGGVKFYRGDYKDAERSYSQLIEMYPNSPFVTEAIKLALISKQLSTGGAAYDSRKLAEARRLVDTAYRNYPELASKESAFLDRQLFSITMQQAEKDYGVAEFYKRTGHPCSAYFCYEVVRRRYPGTKYFDMATEQMQALRSKLEKSQQEEMRKQQPLEGPDTASSGSLAPNVLPGQPGFLPGQLPQEPLPK
jgi:outer membrane protein assembly factor BamD (BamD/ComL family)